MKVESIVKKNFSANKFVFSPPKCFPFTPKSKGVVTTRHVTIDGVLPHWAAVVLGALAVLSSDAR